MCIYDACTIYVKGKYVPTLAKTIHDKNQGNPEVFINLKGLAVGNGEMSPIDQDIYGDYLYQVGFVFKFLLSIVLGSLLK